MTVRTLAAAALLILASSPALATRDLGTMPFSGVMTVEWIASEPSDGDVETVRYRIVGSVDGDTGDGREALLSGFDLRCVGTMELGGGLIQSDEASCRVTDRYGEGMWLDLASGQDTWSWHTLKARFGDGTGPYATVRGEGELTRAMLIPPGSTAPMGVFHGFIRWSRE
ncbi:hypothetical protein [Elioraea rosea]|uniref:hypothetical protein n=1 Tax=Elioraea rosea TaxID=2492390 RepID=UPI0011835AB6|nr:hypothetical protein [Elioraea rosea]